MSHSFQSPNLETCAPKKGAQKNSGHPGPGQKNLVEPRHTSGMPGIGPAKWNPPFRTHSWIMATLSCNAAAASSAVIRFVSAEHCWHQPRRVRIARSAANSSRSTIISVVVLVRFVRTVYFVSAMIGDSFSASAPTLLRARSTCHRMPAFRVQASACPCENSTLDNRHHLKAEL